MRKIIPHLWFDGQAETAARLYTTLFPASRVGRVTRYGKAGFEHHGQPEGSVMTVEFEIDGFAMVGLNGGSIFHCTPAVSYFAMLETAADVDRVWNGLSEGGAVRMPLDAYEWSPRYGWCDDRFGVSWQIALGRRADIGQAVAPSLLFCGDQAGRAEEAITLYISAFPGSRVGGVLRQEGGGIRHAQFSLGGETFMAMDSDHPHGFGFTEANSFLILCRTQDEMDHYAGALSAVPEAEQCGWLKDRFGVSWQVVPAELIDMMTVPDRAKVERVTAAFMEMKRLDLAALRKAYGS